MLIVNLRHETVRVYQPLTIQIVRKLLQLTLYLFHVVALPIDQQPPAHSLRTQMRHPERQHRSTLRLTSPSAYKQTHLVSQLTEILSVILHQSHSRLTYELIRLSRYIKKRFLNKPGHQTNKISLLLVAHFLNAVQPVVNLVHQIIKVIENIRSPQHRSVVLPLKETLLRKLFISRFKIIVYNTFQNNTSMFHVHQAHCTPKQSAAICLKRTPSHRQVRTRYETYFPPLPVVRTHSITINLIIILSPNRHSTPRSLLEKLGNTTLNVFTVRQSYNMDF